MALGNDVLCNMKSFAQFGVRQGSMVVGVNKFGYGETRGPSGGSISGVGYWGIMPSGAVLEGKLTDRFDTINYYS